LEILASTEKHLQCNEYEHEKFRQLGLHPLNQWKCFKVNDCQGEKETFSGLIVISNAFTKDGQLLWSQR
jgi:hypothetical protein